MVRKVGFGDEVPKPKERKSTTDRVLDEFRERAADRKANESAVASTKDKKAAPIGERIFLSVWLFFWTGGILGAFGALISGAGAFGNLFLLFWLCLACVFWVIAARRLFGRN